MTRKFSGLFTALITPFMNDANLGHRSTESRIDYQALEKILMRQVDSGVHGIVVAGTTGESTTLTHDEHRELLRFAYGIVKKKCMMIAGAGSNNTLEAIELTNYAQQCGYDAVLSVVPYYNKPNQQGIIEHFKLIHDSSNIDIILYDVPARTVVGLSNESVLELSKLPRIIGLKDATGDLARVPTLRRILGETFSLLSGEDSTALAFNASGGNGLISVSSNIALRDSLQLQNLTLSGDFRGAYKLQQKLSRFNEVMFCQANPMPVKYAASVIGLCNSDVRLPLVQLSETNKEIVRLALNEIGFN